GHRHPPAHRARPDAATTLGATPAAATARLAAGHPAAWLAIALLLAVAGLITRALRAWSAPAGGS
ncbi:MAG TPA: hypothetical protein VHN98_10825, partial [Acidimicrobiales bacterium]|nr:hypothetical protein [Acidimicrobiales bacterium]